MKHFPFGFYSRLFCLGLLVIYSRPAQAQISETAIAGDTIAQITVTTVISPHNYSFLIKVDPGGWQWAGTQNVQTGPNYSASTTSFAVDGSTVSLTGQISSAADSCDLFNAVFSGRQRPIPGGSGGGGGAAYDNSEPWRISAFDAQVYIDPPEEIIRFDKETPPPTTDGPLTASFKLISSNPPGLPVNATTWSTMPAGIDLNPATGETVTASLNSSATDAVINMHTVTATNNGYVAHARLYVMRPDLKLNGADETQEATTLGVCVPLRLDAGDSLPLTIDIKPTSLPSGIVKLKVSKYSVKTL